MQKVGNYIDDKTTFQFSSQSLQYDPQANKLNPIFVETSVDSYFM